MANLSATQEAHLVLFETAYSVYRGAVRSVEARVRAEVETELLGLRIEASKAGNRAVAAKVPVSRLGEKGRAGMNTRNFGTIRAFLDVTEGFVTATAEELEEAARPVPGADYITPNSATGMFTVAGPDGETFEYTCEGEPYRFKDENGLSNRPGSYAFRRWAETPERAAEIKEFIVGSAS